MQLLKRKLRDGGPKMDNEDNFVFMEEKKVSVEGGTPVGHGYGTQTSIGPFSGDGSMVTLDGDKSKGSRNGQVMSIMTESGCKEPDQ